MRYFTYVPVLILATTATAAPISQNGNTHGLAPANGSGDTNANAPAPVDIPVGQVSSDTSSIYKRQKGLTKIVDAAEMVYDVLANGFNPKNKNDKSRYHGRYGGGRALAVK
ncbi:hypothetical protein GGI12_005486 [Dipsacomyces acuminosporus]|nr:hypothetical protein GGI12_005486 [Dipsacomyces acuminosporus]